MIKMWKGWQPKSHLSKQVREWLRILSVNLDLNQLEINLKTTSSAIVFGWESMEVWKGGLGTAVQYLIYLLDVQHE